MKWLALCLFCVLAGTISAAEDDTIYRMCVPERFYEDCLTLLKDPSEAGIKMKCVKGRDRIDCLDKINNREADVLAADPEDMYVAYHTKNQDYRVISEFRTKVEKDAEFRYEGVILIKKSSNVKSLEELRGKKSCHTGFGRNVGYKIPITKLKNKHVLKVSQDRSISATERELKSLSEFFSNSCLVGKYSPHPEINKMLKKKYSNLCSICEKPEQCDYPDKFSGYDGAIRCLDKGQGEVAFTKTSYIKKYFGLIPGAAGAESDKAADFEYLCEDGSRRPITGPVCSWAQRPWKGYISNSDSVREAAQLKRLQNRLDKFYENGLHAQNKDAAAHLLIDTESVLHEKPTAVEPKEYLERAGYKDVIERDGSISNKMRICVSREIELEKCNALRRAAYSRDIRPDIECVLDTKCVDAVKNDKADVVIVRSNEYELARSNNLKPIVYESFGEDNVYVAVVDPSLKTDLLRKTPINVDKSNPRAEYAARFLNKARGKNACENVLDKGEGPIAIVNSKDLDKYKNKQLLCSNLEKKPVTDYKICNLEANLPTALFTRKDINSIEFDSITNALISISDKFAKNDKLRDVFEVFSAFKPDQKDILFDDGTIEFTTEIKNANNINEDTYKSLACNK